MSAAPTVSGFSPASGSGGAVVTVTGTGFSTTAAQNSISIGTNSYAAGTATATQLTFTISNYDAPLSGPIKVTVGGTTGQSSAAFVINPKITSFTPTSGVAGTSVTVYGTNFPNGAYIQFAGSGGPTWASTASVTMAVVQVPIGASTGPLKVTNAYGTGPTATSSTSFVVPQPTISSFSPLSAPEGATVVINGSNFDPNTLSNNSVTFNGVSATVSAATASTLTVTVPAGATTGLISVSVLGHGANSASNFTVTPAITSFTPAGGGPGINVTIRGTTFGATPSANIVKFNGIQATVTSASTTTLNATVPAGVTTGSITVTANSQTATSASNFFLLPTVSAFTPAAGPGGTLVTVTGTNFSTTASQDVVTFSNSGYSGQATVSAATATSLSFAVPGLPSGTYSLSVSVQGGPAVTASGTYLLALKPTITGFTPSIGPVGTSVTISGSGFSATAADDVVKFNGVTATITAASTSSLTATVPSGASTGPITVTVNQQTATSSSNYTVGTPPPPPVTITSFSPTSGLAGAQVTVYGTNFPSTVWVQFSGSAPAVYAATSNAAMAIVYVPYGAITGPITVQDARNNNLATSASTFTVPAPTVGSLSPARGAEGASVVINGTNFNSNANYDSVTFNGVAATITGASATQLSVTVPVGATTGPVVVNSGGQTVNGGTFTVLPTITGLSPASGNAGTTVYITGTTFGTAPTVAFNGLAATVISSSPTLITTTAPVGVSTGQITVSTNGQSVTSANAFFVIPKITGFTPPAGPAGTPVTITGTDFGAQNSDNVVRFENLPNYVMFATVTAASPTSLTVVPQGGVPDGLYTITLSVKSGPWVSSTSQFQLAPKPQIDSFSPALAPPGVDVTISGHGFSSTLNANVVEFNGLQATVSAASASSLTVKVPPDATSGPITVNVNQQLATSASNFTVGLPAPASVTVPSTTEWPSINVSWAPSQWAAFYQIDAQAPDGNWYAVEGAHYAYYGTEIDNLFYFYGPNGYGPFVNNSVYSFRVRACRLKSNAVDLLCSDYTQSGTIKFQIPPPPAAPATVTLEDTLVEVGAQFRVDWTPGSGGGPVRLISVYYTPVSPGCNATDDQCLMLDMRVQPGIAFDAPIIPGEYYIGIQTINGGGESSITLSSNTLSVIKPKALTAPDKPAWIGVDAANLPVQITWQKSAASGALPDRYELERMPAGGSWASLSTKPADPSDPDVLESLDGSVPSDGYYAYGVRACNSAGCSDWETSWFTQVQGTGSAHPTVSIVSPGSGANFVAPATIVVTANASVVGDTISRVEFYAGATSLCTVTGSGPYNCTWNNVGAGTYSLTATAYASKGTSTSSSAVTITVGAPAGAPAAPTSVTAPSNSTSTTFDVIWAYDETAVPAATSFTLQRVDQSGTPTTRSSALPVSGSPETYHETAPGNGTYYYQVAACIDTLCSAYTRSNAVVIAAGNSTETYYFHHSNALGSVVATTNAQGQIVSASTYRPFGTRLDRPVGGATGSADPPITHIGFTGKWHDEDLKLDYFGARYYDPMFTQFLSLDPAQSTFNRYAYANNNPMGFIDPDGRESACIYRKNHCDYGNPIDPLVGGLEFLDQLMMAWPNAIDVAAEELTLSPMIRFLKPLTDSAAKSSKFVYGTEVPVLAKVDEASAEGAANYALTLGKETGAASELRVGDRVFTGVSTEVTEWTPEVEGALVGFRRQSQYGGLCSEIVCLNKAYAAGVDPAGGVMRTVNIGDSGAGHLTPKAPCESCSDILSWFGVSYE